MYNFYSLDTDGAYCDVVTSLVGHVRKLWLNGAS